MYGDQREWVVPNVQAVGRALKACFRFQIISASYLIAAAVPMSSERAGRPNDELTLSEGKSVFTASRIGYIVRDKINTKLIKFILTCELNTKLLKLFVY